MNQRTRPSWRAVVACLTLLGATTETRAAQADDVVLVRLDYEGRPGCPGADFFVREVLARAPRARRARPSESARALLASVRPAAGRGLEGRLVVIDPGVAATERTVRAESCEELVTALALIAAVVIDPLTAKTGVVDSSATSAEVNEPSADAAAGPASSAAAASITPPPAEGPLPAGRSPGLWAFSAGVGGGLLAGSSPTILVSVLAFVEITHEDREVLSPALRLRFERTSTSSNQEGGAFVRTGGAADLCPIALRAQSVRFQPCGRTEVAALYAKGRGVEPVRSDVRPWLAFGPVARVRVELVPPIFVELEAALMAVAIRDRFYVEPFAVVYRPPAFGATTAFAVGAAF